LSHQDLAERLDVYRETGANPLNELKNANILTSAESASRLTTANGWNAPPPNEFRAYLQ